MLKSFIRYWAVNAPYAALLYLGLTGHTWAWNLFAFCTCVLAILTIPTTTVVACSRQMREGLRAKHPVIMSRWGWIMDGLYDAAIAVALVTTGHFVIGGFYTFHLFLHHAILYPALHRAEKPDELSAEELLRQVAQDAKERSRA